MRQYNIHWKGVVKLLVKYRLNKPKRRAGLYALIYPIIWLYAAFYNYLMGLVYELSKTSQVVHIEAALNDRWDAGLRRIYITDATSLQPVVVYRHSESKTPPYIYQEAEAEPPPYIYTDAELNALGPDFIVMVPNFIVFDMDELVALVNKYKLVGKFFIVQTF